MNRNIVIGVCLLLMGILTGSGVLTYFGAREESSYLSQKFEKDINDIGKLLANGSVKDNIREEFKGLFYRYKNIYQDYKTRHAGFLVIPFLISLFACGTSILFIRSAIAIFRKRFFAKREILYAVIMSAVLFLVSFFSVFTEVKVAAMAGEIRQALMSLLDGSHANTFVSDLSLAKGESIRIIGLYFGILCLVPFLCWFFYQDNKAVDKKV